MPRRSARITYWLFPAAFGACLLALFALHSKHNGSRAVQAEINGPTMGTTYTVRYLPERPRKAAARLQAGLTQTISETLERVNALMSTWREDSEISRFNAHADTTPFAVSRETHGLLELAREISELSGGAFDVTVAPLVDAYGFGAGSGERRPAADAELAALRQRVGYGMIETGRTSLTLRKTRRDVRCDLSAIAKGFGVDAVAEAIETAGVRRYMVEIGGEVRVLGLNATGVPWRIGIERPLDPSSEPGLTPGSLSRVIALRDVAVATSGDYRNFYILEGKRLSHTIDPRTGRPVEHSLASVTVLDARCARADALATALMVLGPEDGLALAKNNELAALFLVRQDGGSFAEKRTRAFDDMLKTMAGD